MEHQDAASSIAWQREAAESVIAGRGVIVAEYFEETFGKRGKTDIYLPWDGGPVFLAECKWWTGPKMFTEHDLPQLLDRCVVWRDTNAAMVLFNRNKDVTAMIPSAGENLGRTRVPSGTEAWSTARPFRAAQGRRSRTGRCSQRSWRRDGRCTAW
ncbi:hypothetical protein [Actinocrispum sp. NPDC049592]|uniref:hypothetical protein n=1 Tax=Actinocrispum sp. NPDC049592 TaxID=3154835 RepID=UPI0034242E86